MKFTALLESLLFPVSLPDQAPLPDPVKPRAQKPAPVSTGVKFTPGGVAYVEAKPEGQEVSAWTILNAQNIGAAGRSKLGTEDEIAAGVARGFSAETVALVRMHWADNKPQAAIAKATGLSLDTVKKITPVFKKGGKP